MMRDPFPEELERGRMKDGFFASNAGDRFGAFLLPGGQDCATLRILANNACRTSHWWEHVSVSTQDRCPHWEEMVYVKNLFWSEDECVVQYHPPKKDYVNCHPYTLHLWRPTRHRDKLPTPPSVLVGPSIVWERKT